MPFIHPMTFFAPETYLGMGWAMDETIIDSGRSVCQYVSEDNLAACWITIREQKVDLKEVYQVLNAIKTVRHPVWTDFMCMRCRFFRGRL